MMVEQRNIHNSTEELTAKMQDHGSMFESSKNYVSELQEQIRTKTQENEKLKQ